jgi:choline kinase
MKAIILAAGRGSRMRQFTEDRPKCLVEVAGVPLFDRQCAALTAAGVTKIGVVTGYKGEALASRPVTRFDNPRWADTNMVASLTMAAAWLRQEPCLISYSDIFYRPDAPAALLACDADIAITYDPNWLSLWSRRFADPLSDAETFRCDESGNLREIGARPQDLGEVQGQYMGLLRFTPAGWQSVEDCLSALEPLKRDRLDMTSLLGLLLARNIPIRAVPAQWRWGEVDCETDLALYDSAPAEFGL